MKREPQRQLLIAEYVIVFIQRGKVKVRPQGRGGFAVPLDPQTLLAWAIYLQTGREVVLSGESQLYLVVLLSPQKEELWLNQTEFIYVAI